MRNVKIQQKRQIKTIEYKIMKILKIIEINYRTKISK